MKNSVIKVSAVIITYNEQRNIGRCMESLMPVTDEFIIVDAHSTDGTLNIIGQKGIHVYKHAWDGFAKAKNYGNSLATGDFILSIDADEELSPALQNSIQLFKMNPTDDVCVVNRLTNYCGRRIRHAGWFPDYKIRLFKKGIAEWKGKVHEELTFSRAITIKRLQGNLNHYSYSTIADHLRKITEYASLAAIRDFEEGKKYYFVTHGLLKPLITFLRIYFFRLGLLDGYYGFAIAIHSAFERFIRFLMFSEVKRKSRFKP